MNNHQFPLFSPSRAVYRESSRQAEQVTQRQRETREQLGVMSRIGSVFGWARRKTNDLLLGKVVQPAKVKDADWAKKMSPNTTTGTFDARNTKNIATTWNVTGKVKKSTGAVMGTMTLKAGKPIWNEKNVDTNERLSTAWVRKARKDKVDPDLKFVIKPPAKRGPLELKKEILYRPQTAAELKRAREMDLRMSTDHEYALVEDDLSSDHEYALVEDDVPDDMDILVEHEPSENKEILIPWGEEEPGHSRDDMDILIEHPNSEKSQNDPSATQVIPIPKELSEPIRKEMEQPADDKELLIPWNEEKPSGTASQRQNTEDLLPGLGDLLGNIAESKPESPAPKVSLAPQSPKDLPGLGDLLGNIAESKSESLAPKVSLAPPGPEDFPGLENSLQPTMTSEIPPIPPMPTFGAFHPNAADLAPTVGPVDALPPLPFEAKSFPPHLSGSPIYNPNAWSPDLLEKLEGTETTVSSDENPVSVGTLVGQPADPKTPGSSSVSETTGSPTTTESTITVPPTAQKATTGTETEPEKTRTQQVTPPSRTSDSASPLSPENKKGTPATESTTGRGQQIPRASVEERSSKPTPLPPSAPKVTPAFTLTESSGSTAPGTPKRQREKVGVQVPEVQDGTPEAKTEVDRLSSPQSQADVMRRLSNGELDVQSVIVYARQRVKEYVRADNNGQPTMNQTYDRGKAKYELRWPSRTAGGATMNMSITVEKNGTVNLSNPNFFVVSPGTFVPNKVR